jgi:hypothetical protein
MSPLERTHLRISTPRLPIDPAVDVPLVSEASSTAIPVSVPSGARDEYNRPVDTGFVHDRLIRHRSRRSTTEIAWYECLVYPLRAYPIVVALTIILTATLGIVVTLLPILVVTPSRGLGPGLLGILGSSFVLEVAYLLGFLEGALATAAAGDYRSIRWPGRDLVGAIRSAAAALLAILGGPVVLMITSFFYWLQCGDLGVVDWLILLELNLLAVGYAFLAFASSARNGRLRDGGPVSVAGVIHRLGGRVVVAALVSALLSLAGGLLALGGCEKLARGMLSGWGLLGAGCMAGLVTATIFFRLVGVWYYRSQPAVLRSSCN